MLPPAKAAPALKNAEPIENFAEIDHVVVNRGPRIDWVEQVTGPLNRTRVEDLVSTHGLGHSIPTPRSGGADATAGGESKWQPSRSPASGHASPEFKRVTESAAQQARTIMQQKQSVPDVIPRILLTDAPLPAGPAQRSGFKPARSDTAH